MSKFSSLNEIPVNSISDSDLFLINKDNGNGTFTSYKMAASKMKLNYQSLLVSGTNIKTINGSSILGSGDITVSSASGKFGISDSNGAYTYYTTLSAAITAATSGQTVEFFTDYTETGNVTISMNQGKGMPIVI